MKTLKQFYKEEEIKEDSHLRSFTQDHIEATRKWLTQKQRTALTYYGEGGYNLINKLIEELRDG